MVYKYCMPEVELLNWTKLHGFGLFLLILSSWTYAQDIDPEVYRRSVAYSEQYERMLSKALSNYYHDESYLIDVRVTLDQMIVPLEYERRQNQNIDPAIDKLPGLPVIPDEWRKAVKDSLNVTEFRREFGIKYVDVTILVDTSYQVEDVGFAIELVKMNANLDDVRGDRVSIKKKVFPELFQNHRKVDTIPMSNNPPTSKDYASNSLGGVLQNELPVILPLILIFVFLALMIWMVLRYLKQSDQAGEATTRHMQTLMMKIEELKDSQSRPTESVGELPPEKTPEYNALRNYVLDNFIGRPQQSSRLLSNWIQHLGDQGLKDSAHIVGLVDEKILDILGPHLGESTFNKMTLRLQSVEELDGDAKLSLLGQFKMDMEAILGNSLASDREGDIFNFLNQLSIRQLRHVLKGESTGIQGLALAQIPSQKAAQILQAMDGAERTGILVSMGQIENVSVQSYKDVAKSLSRKALEVSNMRYVAADGIESILDVIVDMPSESQKKYLQNIAEMDLPLAEKIRRFYLPFEDLIQIPKKQLLELIQDLDRDEMSISLVGSPEELKIHFLESMPERMAQAVAAGIESSIDVGGEKVEEARKKLMHHLRSEIAIIGGLE